MASADSSTGSPTGRTLATLAPELLDLIFDNLLKVTDEHCHITGVTDSADSGARKIRPKIHAAILLANRRLAELGQRYLYGQNHQLWSTRRHFAERTNTRTSAF